MRAFTGRSLALEVLLALVMPLRAARTVRELRRDVNLLIRVLAHATGDGRPELLEAGRPAGTGWYDRPMPLAALLAIVRPARAVRKLRSGDDAIAWMLDAMVAQQRKHAEG